MKKLSIRNHFNLSILFLLSMVFICEADQIAFDSDDSIEEIEAKIVFNGYEFTVSHNRIFDMSPAEKDKFLPERQLPEVSPINQGFSPIIDLLPADLPDAFDWRNVGGKSYIGEIRDQGDCGGCYSFGACATAESAVNVSQDFYNENCINLSESFILWCLGRLPDYNFHFFGCSGSDYGYYELTALTTEGICFESTFPYVETDPGSCTHWDDPRITFESWHRIDCQDIDAIKAAIYNFGAVDAAVYVTSAFQAYSSGIYEDTLTSCNASPCYNASTNHVISIVGWDDNGNPESNGYWILRNSWDSDWGEDGYMRIKYHSARISCATAYLVYTPPTPLPTGTPPSPTPTPSLAPVLLVDDDNAGDYETYYTESLDHLSLDYDIWEVMSQGSPSSATLMSYTTVIWFTGDDYTTTLSSTDETNLAIFLENSGTLFITGQDIGYDIQTDAFFRSYFHAGFSTDNENDPTLTGLDIFSGRSVTISGSGGADNQGFPDRIYPRDGGIACWDYSDGHYGGVTYSGEYCLVYFSWGFEGINSSVSRDAILGDVMDFLGSCHGTPTWTATRTPTPTRTPTMTPWPTFTPTNTYTPPPTETPSPRPSDTPTDVPTASPSAFPTQTAVPTATTTPQEGLLRGIILFERPGEEPPLPCFSVPLQVTFCGGQTASVESDEFGRFELPVPLGTVDVLVKNGHALARLVAGVVILPYPEVTEVDFGIFLEGDTDGNNAVTSADFFILRDSYNLSSGQPGYVAGADFNEDGQVTSDDFFLLRSHYNVAGEVCSERF